MENKEKVRKIMKNQGKVMENDEKVRKIMKNQRKILENEEKVRKNEGKPMKNEGKVMENKEKVRKPCPRPKKKNKTRKKNPKKYPHTYQCMFIVDQTVLPNDQSGHVSQCFSREPGICVCGLQGEREREENHRILECAVLLLDESCWSNVAHTVCRWKKNQLQPQLGNDPL
jgi:hypothetical protein